MKLSEFKFKLPENQIAQFPPLHREDAKMLVLHRKTGAVEHKKVSDLVNYFDEKDVLVFNDTKVFPARLYGIKEKTNAEIEVFLLRELNHDDYCWDALVEPARKIRIGNKLYLDDDNTITGEIIDNTTSRGRTIRFESDYTPDELEAQLYAMGHTPLPEYIRRPMKAETARQFRKEFMVEDDADIEAVVKEMDEERYQSVFAKNIGAVAAPASSIHISKNLLKRIEIRGISYTTLTSHVGLGNFKIIDVEDLSKHKVDSEQIIIKRECVEMVNSAKLTKKRICAVGTEIMRALESVAGTNGLIKEYEGWTNRFIFPPYDTLVPNALLVNLYFPLSLQLMMVAAFGGYEQVMGAYKEALKKDYRFGDYGDAMLIVD
ncbi:MAG: S-adenosylmethionine:tRNA ribosyltransferase-isomerase [Paludibacteraceae bacterium]|nr:S-adenosylmethionine:tRNA ribosyltransferase-isomerase [Paludibacteraceae bacterium]